MAIDAYVGLPGHGKSYGVTEHVIIPSIKDGRHVVTNIPMMRDMLLADFGVEGSELTQLPEDWYERPDLAELIPKGCVLVLDELWRRWPAGLKSNDAHFGDKALLAEHRHRVDDKGRSMRVVLVSQDLAQLASWVRLLVEQTYRMTKLTSLGSSKKFRVDVYSGAPTGQNPPKSRRIRQLWGSYKPKVFKYYSSATQSATGSVGDESKSDKRGNVLRSPAFLAMLIVPIIALPFLVWQGAHMFKSGLGQTDKLKAAHEAVAVNPAPPGMDIPASVPVSTAPGQTSDVQAATNPPPPQPSTVWRVAGSIRRTVPDTGKMQDMVILKGAFAGLRYIPTSDCTLESDGFTYVCMVDGTVAAPWTGQGSSTNWAADGQTLAKTAQSSAQAASNGVPQSPSI